MTRFIEMRIADTAAGQSYGGSSAGFAEREVGSANADGRRDAAFAKVQANAGEEFDRAATAETHRAIVRAFPEILRICRTERQPGARLCKRTVYDRWIRSSHRYHVHRHPRHPSQAKGDSGYTARNKRANGAASGKPIAGVVLSAQPVMSALALTARARWADTVLRHCPTIHRHA